MLTTTITTFVAVLFAVTSAVSFVLAAAGVRWDWDDIDNALLFTGGAMFGWAAIAMLWGVGV